MSPLQHAAFLAPEPAHLGDISAARVQHVQHLQAQKQWAWPAAISREGLRAYMQCPGGTVHFQCASKLLKAPSRALTNCLRPSSRLVINLRVRRVAAILPDTPAAKGASWAREGPKLRRAACFAHLLLGRQ